jgi:beta-ureidopropionase / N-carbamoyl-L-amino-acid hydrolase
MTTRSPLPIDGDALQPTPSVDGERLWRSLMDLARVGATPKGGNCRVALTALDGQGRDLVVGWMREAGLQVRVDRIGNIFGTRPGSDAAAPTVMTGSHIDTQPTGGKFDGCYGVLAGLEVMRTLNDHAVRTRAPLELAIWTNEEGSRFLPVMMGSGVFAGKVALEQALASRDREGRAVQDELAAIGYGGSEVARPRIGAYFEAHIEQGPVLEHEDKTIGVVTGSLGVRWYEVVVTGKEMHAGPTPMPVRRDALQAASHLLQAVNAIALAHAPEGRGTVGTLHVVSGSRNVVPGHVEFTVDLRHPDPAVLDAMAGRWEAVCADVAQRLRVGVRSTEVQRIEATRFDAELVRTVDTAARRRRLPAMAMPTGAGHDAVNLAAVAPTAMIFVPCKDGVSHNEAEEADPAHLEAGCNVLLDALLDRAGRCP